MAEVVVGYNIGISILDSEGEPQLVVGTTSNTFGITPEIKERLTKADKGFKRSTKTGYGYTFTVEALSYIKESGETTFLDRDDIIDLTLALGDDGEFEFYYGPIEAGSKVRKGKAIINSFSESTDSENDGTISISCTGVSELEPYTLPTT